MTSQHYENIPQTAVGWLRAEELICAAARLGSEYPEDPDAPRHPVTVGYWEQRKELRPVNKRDGSVELEWKAVPGQYVHTVRTIEPFDVQVTDDGATIFRVIDRCPRDQKRWATEDGRPVHTGPGIRTVRVDRITDITVRRRNAYRYPNRYFIEQVRKHADAQGLTKITDLAEDALWEVIKLARDREDAERRARQYAAR